MTRDQDYIKLIRNLIKGDALSFDDIFYRYNKRVYLFSVRYLRNKEDAEGVVQEVFYNLWKDRAKLKEVKDLDAWIFKVCFNIIRKRFRQMAAERKHLKDFSEIAESYESEVNAELEYENLITRAENILEKLSERQRTIFLLSKRDGFSNSEIAQKLGVTKKTVENHLTNAKTLIRKTLVDDRLISVLFFALFIS